MNPLRTLTLGLLGKIGIALALVFSFTPTLPAAYWTPASPATGVWADGAGTAKWSSISNDPSPSSFWANNSNSFFQRSASMQVGLTNNASVTLSAPSLVVDSGSTLTLTAAGWDSSIISKALLLTGSSSGNVILDASGFVIAANTLELKIGAAFDGTIEAKNDNRNIIVLTSAAAGGVNTKISLTGGRLSLSSALVGQTAVIGELSGSAGAIISPNYEGGAGIRTLEVSQSTNTVFAGTISAGTGLRQLALTKSGSGRLELTGTNTYEASTIITAGTLLISGGGSINGTSGVSMNGATGILRYDSSVALTRTVTFGASGGTVLYNSAAKYTGGSGSILADTGDTIGGDGVLGNVTIASGGTLTPGELGNGSAGMLTVDSLTLQAGATSRFDVLSAVLFDSVHSTGTKTLAGGLNLSFASLLTDGATLDFFTGGTAGSLTGNFASISAAGAYSGSFALDGGVYRLESGQQVLTFDHLTGVLSAAAIPEPSSVLLLTAGLMTILFLRRRPSKNL